MLNAMRFPEAQLNLVRELTEEIAAADSRDALLIWSKENKRDIEELPDKLADHLREVWKDKHASLPKGEKVHV